jgi:predicted dehydrogenase
MGIDLHIHDTHFIRMMFGPPREVRSRGLLVGDGLLDYVTTQYVFDDPGLIVTSQSGAINAAGRPFTQGFELQLERATIVFESGTIPLTVYGADGTTTHPVLPPRTDVDSFVDQIQRVVNTVTSGADPGPLAAERAREALALCLAEAESVRLGRPVNLT